MKWIAPVTFGVLAVATFAAFFVAQRLKRAPPLVLRTNIVPDAFSPNGDGVRDRVRVAVRLKESDDASMAVVDKDGDVVRELVRGRPLRAHGKLRVVWNGRDDDGRRVPDGFYAFRLGLRRSGRSVRVPTPVRLDTKKPDPRLVRVAGRPAAKVRAPLIAPAGHATPVDVRFSGSTRRRSTLVVSRTERPKPEVVARAFAPPVRHRLTWNGEVGGAPARPGVYRLQVQVRDEAGNVALSPASAPGGGVTVRALAVQPPATPVRAGRHATVLVDARGNPWRWRLRRAGGVRAQGHGSGRGVRLRVRAPRKAGLYVLTVASGSASVAVPLAVRDTKARRVLLVLPALQWAARAPVDDDGDGTPDTLPRGGPALLARPFPAAPAGLGDDARLPVFLDRSILPYDVTTDAALALGRGPKLDDARGVLLVGRSDWLPAALQRQLRAYVRGGGRVATFADRTLRRTVALKDGRLEAPSPLRATDAFGARLERLTRRPADLTVYQNGAGVFDTVNGLFRAWPAWEATRSPGPGTRVAAAGPDPEHPVIVGIELGDGLVIRAGVPGWNRRLGGDPSVSSFTEQAWNLLSR